LDTSGKWAEKAGVGEPKPGGVEKQEGKGGRRQTDPVRAKPAEKKAMELRLSRG